MSIGRVWSRGSHDQYRHLGDMFNGKVGRRKALIAFAERLEDPQGTTNLIVEQAKLFFPSRGKDRKTYFKHSRPVAQNWYGDPWTDGIRRPMWSRTTVTRPAEMHRVNCEARALLARLLADGARRCVIYGQCEHPDFEVRLCWPRWGYQGEEVSMFVAAGNDYLYNTPISTELHYGDGTAKQPSAKQRKWDVERRQPDADKELRKAVRKLRRTLNDPSPGRGQVEEAERRVQRAEEALVSLLARHPDPKRPAFRGTALAVADDGGLPLIGQVRRLDLRDLLDDPREPRLSQTPEEWMDPSGAPCAGVSFTWDRTAHGWAPPYTTIDQALAAKAKAP